MTIGFQSGRFRIGFGALALALIVAFLYYLGPLGERDSPWALRATPTGAYLDIWVAHGCDRYGGTVVRESETEVQIRAVTRPPWIRACGAVLSLVPDVVKLSAPLADRALIGCHVDSAQDTFLNENCADVVTNPV